MFWLIIGYIATFLFFIGLFCIIFNKHISVIYWSTVEYLINTHQYDLSELMLTIVKFNNDI